MRLEFRVEAARDGSRLGNYLRGAGVSMHLLRGVKYLENGLMVNGSRARTNLVLRTGDVVAVNLPQPAGFSARPEPFALPIVYESGHALVVEKPPGLVVHPTLSHEEHTMANAFCGLLQSRGESGGTFRPIGRLDRNTSGLQLCAMNAYAAPVLTKTAQKTYMTITCGVITYDNGIIDESILPCPDSAIKQCVHEQGKRSVTEYRVLARGRDATLVEARPLTGRTHQIRVHFAHLGHPLLGDSLYGEDDRMARHALHAARLCFTEPAGEGRSFYSSPPRDMMEAAAQAGIEMERYLAPV